MSLCVRLDDIRNWIGDIASGHIKDAKLALTETQVSTLLFKVNSLLSQIDEMKGALSDKDAEIVSLKLQLYDKGRELSLLAEKLSQANKASDRLHENCEKMLKLFFEANRELSDRQIASATQLHPGEAQYFLDTLQEYVLTRWCPF